MGKTRSAIMSASELLDVNTVVTSISTTGEAPAVSGVTQVFTWRADPNSAWDPSQSGLAAEIQLKYYTGDVADATPIDVHKLDPFALKSLPLHHCMESISFLIDGVTVAQCNDVAIEGYIYEKYLRENSKANTSNFESQITMRNADTGTTDANPWTASCAVPLKGANGEALEDAHVFLRKVLFPQEERPSASGAPGVRRPNPIMTVFFQPPFGMWRNHQIVNGGNFQLQITWKTATTNQVWGQHIGTGLDDIHSKAYYANDIPAPEHQSTPYVQGGAGLLTHNVPRSDYVGVPGASTTFADYQQASLRAEILRVKLWRRVVRLNVPRPVSTQSWLTTGLQLLHGTSTSIGAGSAQDKTDTFRLPTSTFAVVVYFADATNSSHLPFSLYPAARPFTRTTGTDNLITNAAATTTVPTILYDTFTADQVNAKRFELDYLQLTYGGITVPQQRINAIASIDIAKPMGSHQMHLYSMMMQGLLNMPMENMLMAPGAGNGFLTRLSHDMYFFPLNKGTNADAPELQVDYRAVVGSNLTAAAKVVAFYDRRVDLSYTREGALATVAVTEWK